MLLLARGKGQRAHDQTTLLPRLGLSGLIWRSEFDHISKTNRYWISRLIARAVSGWQSDLAWLEHVTQDGVEHAVEFRVRHLLGGEWTQVVVLVRHDLGAYTKGRHLAVANVGEAGTLGGLADLGNLRQIERVVGRLAGDDRRRQRPAEGVEHRYGDVHLRQIGAMILAVSQLEQPFGRHVGPRRRHVDAHDAALQVIDAHDGLVEVAFKRAPT